MESIAGTKGAIFLDIGQGANAQSIGGTPAVANAKGSGALYWNPAGLAASKGKEAIASFNSQFENNVQNGYLAATLNNCGLSITYLNVDGIEERDDSGNKLSSFGSNSLAICASYGKELSGKTSVGGSIKFINESIKGDASIGGAIDLGIHYQLSPKTSLGATINNLGVMSAFEKENDPLPANLKLAAAWDSHNLIVGAGTTISNYQKLGVAIGAEYILRSVALRAGADSSKPGYGISAGFGVNYRNLSIDYAFNPHPDLGDSHRVSLTLKY
jgi:hypothetical protein